MTRYLAALLACLVVLGGTAEAKRKKQDSGGGFGWFGPALSFVDYGAMNAELDAVGVDGLNPLHWQFGGGGHAYIDRVVIGGAGWGGTQTVSSDSQVVRVDLGGGQFEVGYSPLILKHLIVTPMLGIGGGGYTVTVENRNVPNTFREFLENPGPSSSIEFTGFQLTPLLQVTIPVSFVGITLRGGYSLVPENPAWKFPNGGNLARGPEVARGYPFASLNVAFGGFDITRRGSKKKD